MNKRKYCVTLEIVNKLKEGQTFKSNVDLIKHLGMVNDKGKPLSGNSRDQFLEDLNRYVEFKKEDTGYAITVSRIRPADEILPMKQTGGNNKYSLMLQNLIAFQLLRMCDGRNGVELFWSPYNLLFSCGMTNKSFVTYDYDLKKKHQDNEKNYTEDQKKENKKLEADAKAFKYNAKSVMKKYAGVALKSMTRNGEIIAKEEPVVFIYNNPRNVRVPTKEEAIIYMRMKNRIITSYYTSSGMKCVSEQDIFMSGHSEEYYKELSEQTYEIFGCDSAYPMYHIIAEPDSLQRAAKRIEKTTQAQEFLNLNNAMCENLPQLVSVRRGKSIKVPNPKYEPDSNESKYIFEYQMLSDEITQQFVNQTIRTNINVRNDRDIPFAQFEIV